MTYKPFVTYGLTAGIATIALFLLFYLIAPSLMLHPAAWWGSLLIYLVAMWVAGRKVRLQSAQPLSFRRAMQHVFPVFVIANALFYAFWYVLLRTDESLIELQFELLKSRGWEGERELLYPSMGRSLLMLLQSFVGGGVLSALLALGLKEE